jgi:hypothetical protein
MPVRLLPRLAALALAAAGLTGCVAIKTETAAPRAPGVVTLTLSVCASDRDTAGSTCNPDANTAEEDNGSDALHLDPPVPPTSLLVGFRVPDGAAAPNEFRSQDGEVLDHSASYSSELNANRPSAVGLHWEGYVSSTLVINAGQTATTFSAEFGLPAGQGGAPFAGPFKWRAVVGFQAGVVDPATPISCSQLGADCFDSPPAADLVPQLDRARAVSDFRVLAGTGATAAPGETATVAFPVRYSDAAGFGAQTLSLSATSGLPGAPRPAAPASLAIAPGATPSVSATVTVPPGTPPGTYPVTLTAAAGAPAVTRANTATITVVDRTAPSIAIGSPTDGETLTQGQQVAAAFGCADEAGGSGVAACTGTVGNGAPLDTASPGRKTFAVAATDNAGNAATLTRTYTVLAPVIVPAPRINVTTTFLFAARRTFTRFTSLAVKEVPRGATVTATCRGHGCPTHKVKGKRRAVTFTKRNASGSVTLKPWLRKRLPVGTRLTATVTKPGFVGMVKTLTVRRSKPPQVVTRCLAPRAKTPSRCT